MKSIVYRALVAHFVLKSVFIDLSGLFIELPRFLQMTSFASSIVFSVFLFYIANDKSRESRLKKEKIQNEANEDLQKILNRSKPYENE